METCRKGRKEERCDYAWQQSGSGNVQLIPAGQARRGAFGVGVM